MKKFAQILVGILSLFVILLSPGLGCYSAIADIANDAAAGREAVNQITLPAGLPNEAFRPALDFSANRAVEAEVNEAGRVPVEGAIQAGQTTAADSAEVSAQASSAEESEVGSAARMATKAFAGWIAEKTLAIQAVKQALQNGDLSAALSAARRPFKEAGANRKISGQPNNAVSSKVGTPGPQNPLIAVSLSGRRPSSKVAEPSVPQPVESSTRVKLSRSVTGALGTFFAAVIPAAAGTNGQPSLLPQAIGTLLGIGLFISVVLGARAMASRGLRKNEKGELKYGTEYKVTGRDVFVYAALGAMIFISGALVAHAQGPVLVALALGAMGIGGMVRAGVL